MKRTRSTQEAAIEALKAGVEVEGAKFAGMHLKGVRVKIAPVTAVVTPREHVLYRFYDDEGSLLYVGITMSPLHRFKGHEHEKTWWGEVKWIKLEDHPDEDSARAAELAAIRSEHPKYNVAGMILATNGHDPLLRRRARAGTPRAR